MVLNKKKILAPKLRFSEFDSGWKKETLSTHIEMISGIAIKGEDISEDANGIPILRGINITEGKIRHSKDIDRYYKLDASQLAKFRLKVSDLVIGMDGSKVGKNVALISERDSDSLLIQRVARLRPINNTSIVFVYQHINSIRFHKYVDEVNTSSGIPHISAKQINDFTLYFPSLPEQQKIASFLSAVDEKIQQLTRKKELLEQYKKGVMQQLFSGKLRFKNEKGKSYPEWEEKRLGGVAERVTRKNKENNLNVLTISAQQGLISQLEYFNKQISSKDVTNYYLLEKNEFAYNKSYSTGYPMGAIKRLIKYDKGVVSTLYICFRFSKDVSLDFMEQYFENGKHNIEIEKVAQEGARNHGLLNIGVTDFLNIKLELPPLDEQIKIANYLSLIDNRIQTVNNQISRTQTFKKGLLQQMFV
ncbi:MAG: hypothetical protein K0Q95_3363 [Bacteroidota bacterium]|nr:hypothetical protein [Bacteroidota bacterium]